MKQDLRLTHTIECGIPAQLFKSKSKMDQKESELPIGDSTKMVKNKIL